LRNLTNGKKGFFIRCTFINPKRVYESAIFFYSAPLDGAQLAGGQGDKSGFGILGFFLGFLGILKIPKSKS
jgi:hypothetical protein